MTWEISASELKDLRTVIKWAQLTIEQIALIATQDKKVKSLQRVVERLVVKFGESK